MPSLRETLRGHLAAGHDIVLLLPRYHLFQDRPIALAVQEDEGYQVHIVPCRWAPPLFSIRRLARRISGGAELIYPLRWLLNMSLFLLLTGSLCLEILRVKYQGKHRFDLVYAHNQYASLAGWLAGCLLRVPNVTRLYGTFLADLMKRPLVVMRYPVAAAGYLVPHSLLICANDGTRGDEVAHKLKINEERFRFWQNGVDIPLEPIRQTREETIVRFDSRGLRLDSKWVLSCSRLSYWKRIDRIIRALRVARAKGCDCQLLVAGSGAEEEGLRTLAVQLEVQKEIIWLGAVDHDTIWQLMHVADVFMITNDVTNRCNPLFEAICAALPVVSVHDESTKDLLEHEVNALLADRDDFEGLGEQLHRVCSEPHLAALLSHNQKSCREGLWSWQERMATEVRELETLVMRNKASQSRLEAETIGT